MRRTDWFRKTDPGYCSPRVRGTTVYSTLRLTHFVDAVLELPVPHEREQERIGRLFVRLDSLITLHQRKHDQLATLKKSLLEKMFV